MCIISVHISITLFDQIHINNQNEMFGYCDRQYIDHSKCGLYMNGLKKKLLNYKYEKY